MGTSTLDASVGHHGPSVQQPFEVAASPPPDRGFPFESEKWIFAVLVVLIIELAGLLLYLVGRALRRRCVHSSDASCSAREPSCSCPSGTSSVLIGEVASLPQKAKDFSTPLQGASHVHSECSTFEALPNDFRLSSSHSGGFCGSSLVDSQSAGLPEQEHALVCGEDSVWQLKAKDGQMGTFDSDASISSLSRVFPTPLMTRASRTLRVDDEDKAREDRSGLPPAALLAALEGVSEAASKRNFDKRERNAVDRSGDSLSSLVLGGRGRRAADPEALAHVHSPFSAPSLDAFTYAWKGASTLHGEDITDMKERRMYSRKSMLQCRVALQEKTARLMRQGGLQDGEKPPAYGDAAGASNSCQQEQLLLPLSSLELLRSLRCEAVEAASSGRPRSSLHSSRSSRFSSGGASTNAGSAIAAFSSQDSLDSLSAADVVSVDDLLHKRDGCAEERLSRSLAALAKSPVNRRAAPREESARGEEVENIAEERRGSEKLDRGGVWRRSSTAEGVAAKAIEKSKSSRVALPPRGKGEFEHVLERAMKLKQLDIAITVHDSLRAENVKIDRKSYMLLVQIAMSRKDVALQSQWLLEMIDEGHAIDACWLDRLLAAASVCDPTTTASLYRDLESRSTLLSPECLAVLQSAKTYISVGTNLMRRAAGSGSAGSRRLGRQEELKRGCKSYKGGEEDVTSDASPSRASCEGKAQKNGETGVAGRASESSSPSSAPTLNPNAPEFVPLTLRSLPRRLPETVSGLRYAFSPSFSPPSMSPSQVNSAAAACPVTAATVDLSAFGTTSSTLSPGLSKANLAQLSTLRLLQTQGPPPGVPTPDAVAASLLAMLSTSLSPAPGVPEQSAESARRDWVASRGEEALQTSAEKQPEDSKKSTLRLQMQEMYTRAKEGRGKVMHTGSGVSKDKREKERTGDKSDGRRKEETKVTSCLDQFQAFNDKRMSDSLNSVQKEGKRGASASSSENVDEKEGENEEKSVKLSLPDSDRTSVYHGDDERGASDSGQSELEKPVKKASEE
uniref:Putative transmembrane protein n=1 Tax=Toxoplasma gondii COUG TaxID=1074873 RepID=A0A2G8XUE3_TOXGO|nr:putative transmembrane protein [Toxoplasma gondii COUG]